MKNILLTLIVFGSFGLSGSLQSKEPTYLSCNCTKAINSLITTGGCWDEKILITLDKANNKMEWGDIEYPNLRQWMDFKVNGNEFKGVISRTHYRLNRVTLIADSRYQCSGENAACRGAHEFYSCKVIKRQL